MFDFFPLHILDFNHQTDNDTSNAKHSHSQPSIFIHQISRCHLRIFERIIFPISTKKTPKVTA